MGNISILIKFIKGKISDKCKPEPNKLVESMESSASSLMHLM
jgi:hypothetical protein